MWSIDSPAMTDTKLLTAGLTLNLSTPYHLPEVLERNLKLSRLVSLIRGKNPIDFGRSPFMLFDFPRGGRSSRHIRLAENIQYFEVAPVES